ncbi:MAG TPA: DUF2277 domain-containing protein [Anaerolineales bacterium]|nr:DUF2277 domain-containing protein [Anaerolineales bacterium]
MCRNIKKLRQPQSSASDEEIELAALQFVRKVSGYRKPSQKNTAAFDLAVREVAAATRSLLINLQASSAPTPDGGHAGRG